MWPNEPEGIQSPDKFKFSPWIYKDWVDIFPKHVHDFSGPQGLVNGVPALICSTCGGAFPVEPDMPILPETRGEPEAWMVQNVVNGVVEKHPYPVGETQNGWFLQFSTPYPTEPGILWRRGLEYYQVGYPLYRVID